MKDKKLKNILLLTYAGIAVFSLPLLAQPTYYTQTKKLVSEAAPTNYALNNETLSGIKLYKAKKGTFNLLFEQKLKEDAVLKVSNTAGKIIFQKPLSIKSKVKRWHYNVGRLDPDTYLVEVKTSYTTYWSRFQVGK